ncbi:hypothetical protein DFA_11287 [Cavenderia fasciculata]|uniref:CARDB domain-containing protein n=1 Tax=Cavenderia fasciculata TaxID=261658 RepID=F4QC39_CACFS|nr:uncharacterized protein DFA_11287 [Cavenderia fasciculata]EGG13526.1 hypothetical protein DFA_11287 [Cavenderia fasciculata]|eukprot:XP_004350230.1 hypothetical protein DFA_11287 [Cavenderia fasciculata]
MSPNANLTIGTTIQGNNLNTNSDCPSGTKYTTTFLCSPTISTYFCYESPACSYHCVFHSPSACPTKVVLGESTYATNPNIVRNCSTKPETSQVTCNLLNTGTSTANNVALYFIYGSPIYRYNGSFVPVSSNVWQSVTPIQPGQSVTLEYVLGSSQPYTNFIVIDYNNRNSSSSESPSSSSSSSEGYEVVCKLKSGGLQVTYGGSQPINCTTQGLSSCSSNNSNYQCESLSSVGSTRCVAPKYIVCRGDNLVCRVAGMSCQYYYKSIVVLQSF